MNPPTILECYVRFLNALLNKKCQSIKKNSDFSAVCEKNKS